MPKATKHTRHGQCDIEEINNNQIQVTSDPEES